MDATALGRELDRRYRLPGEAACRLEVRAINDLYYVRYGGRRLACRVWRAARQTDWPIGCELEFVRLLAWYGVAVALPVAAADGSLLFTVAAPEGDRAVALFEWIDGRRASFATDPAVFTRVGEELAHLHDVAPRLTEAPRVRDDAGSIRRTLPALVAAVAGRGDDTDFFRTAADRLLPVLDRVSRSGGQPIHGDCHFDNAFVDDAGRTTLMDFDAAGVDSPLKDLAAFFWRCDYAGAPSSVNEAFLAGYERRRPLRPEARQLLPALVAARGLFIVTAVAARRARFGPTGVGYRHDVERHRATLARHLSLADMERLVGLG